MDVQIDQLGGEWDVRGDGDVASRGVRRDVVIRYVEAVLNQNEAHLVVVGGQAQSVVRHQHRLELKTVGRTKDDLADGTRSCVGIDPEDHGRRSEG